MGTQQHFLSRITFLFLLFGFLGMGLVQAQGTQISFEDDDDEDEAVENTEGPGEFEEVLIRLNGEEVLLSEDVEVNRNDTLSIEVRHLRPNSWVAIHIQKSKLDIVKRRFQSNELGQLDLEVRTGKRKVSGTAVVYYTPSKGEKKSRNVKVRVL